MRHGVRALVAIAVGAAHIVTPAPAHADDRQGDARAEAADESSKDESSKEEKKPNAEEPADKSSDEKAADAVPLDPARQKARELFMAGSELVRRSQWAEGLEAFEKSAKLRPHAVTRYNIGTCLRATGRYVQAREAFMLALGHHRGEENGRLSDRLLDETRAFLDEVESIMVRLDVRLAPANAAIAIDGRPLERVGQRNGRPVMLAGTLPAGKGKVAPTKRFDVVLNPGAHVITLSRKGFEDAVVNKTFKPGTRDKLDLKISKLAATLVIDASESEAVVTVDGHDVGFAPVKLSRPGGDYLVTVEKEGFAPYETTASVDAGAVWRVSADMPVQMPPLYERWWFWTTLVGTAGAIAVTTYVVTMPEPERPAPNCGGLSWCIEVD
jgi:hypothetical protein